MATRGRPPWFHPVILCALTTAGCIVKVNGPTVDSRVSPFDLITEAQFVDPATLPAPATAAGIPLTGASPLTGSSLTVGLEGRPGYSVMTTRTGPTPGYVSPVRNYGSERSANRGYGRDKWPGAWEWNSIVFQPTRIEVHRISTTAYPSSPAIQEDADIGDQDADRNVRSSYDGTWIRLPAARAQGFAILDLLELAAGSPDFAFGTAQLPEGHYNQIRFWGADSRSGRENANNTFHAVDASGIVRSGVYKLPGQALVVNVSFDIRRDQTTELFCSFDPVDALKIAGRRVMLRPSTLRASVSYRPAPPPPSPVTAPAASPSSSPDSTSSPDPKPVLDPLPTPGPVATPTPGPVATPGPLPTPGLLPTPSPSPKPTADSSPSTSSSPSPAPTSSPSP